MDATLSAAAARVLGVLVEKELSTPDYYPMTLNALVQGCNQKTNRDPVVQFGEGEVLDALDELRRHHLAGTQEGAHSRATKYRHALHSVFDLDAPACAVLASLLLRGPQTPGELRARTSRMHTFDEIEAVAATLDALQQREEPLVAELPKEPGRREARYTQLLTDEVPEVASAPSDDALAAEVADLRARLDALEAAFDTFRQQFE